MKKVLSIILSVLLLISLISGCADNSTGGSSNTSSGNSSSNEVTEQPGEDKDIVIAYICKALDQQWFQGVSKAIKENAIAMGAKDVIMIDAQMNPEAYITALDNVIAQKVDGIIVVVPDQNLSRITIQKANEAGIPILADADPLIENGVRLAPSLELDAFLVGQQAGEWLANEVISKNLVKDPDSTGYMVLTMNTVSSVVPRSEGQLEAWNRLMPDFPQKNIFDGDYNGETEKGFNVMAATITANPQIKTWFVTAGNEEGAVGAVRALEQAGLDKEAVVVGLGAYFAKDEFKKPYSAMKAAAYFDPKVDGIAVSTAMMEYILNGKEIFGEYKKDGQEFGMFPLGAVMVTPENYVEIMGPEAE